MGSIFKPKTNSSANIQANSRIIARLIHAYDTY